MEGCKRNLIPLFHSLSSPRPRARVGHGRARARGCSAAWHCSILWRCAEVILNKRSRSLTPPPCLGYPPLTLSLRIPTDCKIEHVIVPTLTPPNNPVRGISISISISCNAHWQNQTPPFPLHPALRGSNSDAGMHPAPHSGVTTDLTADSISRGNIVIPQQYNRSSPTMPQSWQANPTTLTFTACRPHHRHR